MQNVQNNSTTRNQMKEVKFFPVEIKVLERSWHTLRLSDPMFCSPNSCRIGNKISRPDQVVVVNVLHSFLSMACSSKDAISTLGFKYDWCQLTLEEEIKITSCNR